MYEITKIHAHANSYLVTLDVSFLCTNILHDDGLKTHTGFGWWYN